MRFADDFVVGFEHRDDAERFWADLRDRLAKFGLELNAEKTRLIEFGRFAARDERRGVSASLRRSSSSGSRTSARRREDGAVQAQADHRLQAGAAKLRAVKAELMRRRHQPIPEQGRWLASVLRGHYQLLRGARQQRGAQRLPLLRRPALANGRFGVAASATG